MRFVSAVGALFLLLTSGVSAHVRISPAEASRSATQTYVARVPTERPTSTTSVRIEIPDGVEIDSASPAAGGKVELIRDGDRVRAIEWTVDIPSGTSAELSFVARNPATGDQLTWKAVQRYADGSQSEWTGPAGSRTPAPVTTLR